ncbi:MAG: hypothetical protein EXS64_03885 [Candidatus Latescibacteria bacterium]|nr:hypothetical protein [Candidatus Latescibacterota bacterium]
MLKTMRNVGFIKVMMWVVSICFVGLIVLEWGADIGGRKADRANVGKINSRAVSYQEFDTLLKQAYRQQKDQGGREPDLGALVQETWERLVAETLLNEEIRKRGIVVSDAEVDYVNRHQPMEFVQNQQTFQTGGKFDPAKYNQFLDNPTTYSNPQAAQFVHAVEGSIEKFLRTQKLQERVAAAVKVTDAEARQAYTEQREQLKAEYAATEAGSIPDAEAPVSDAEISAYYEAHKNDFEQGEAVRCDFVAFDKRPTAEDEKAVEAEVRRLLDRARAGEDFARLAQEHSDDPGSATNGGDLGFFGKGRMVPAFEQAAFSLQPGQVSEPIRTQFGWHILKVEERKTENGQEQVKARHILRRVEKSRDALDQLRDRAEAFLEQARKRGFAAAASAAGLQTHDTGFFSKGTFAAGLGNRTSGLVASFLHRPEGEVSSLVENEQGFFVYALKGKRKAGIRPLDEARQMVTARIRQEKKVAVAKRRMEQVAAAVRSGVNLQDAARTYGATYDTTGLFARQGFIPRVGNQNEFFGAAFRLTGPGQVSDAVTTDRAAYVIKLIERRPSDEQGFSAAKDAIKANLADQKRSQIFATWFEDLKKHADIEDHRYMFFSEY